MEEATFRRSSKPRILHSRAKVKKGHWSQKIQKKKGSTYQVGPIPNGETDRKNQFAMYSREDCL